MKNLQTTSTENGGSVGLAAAVHLLLALLWTFLGDAPSLGRWLVGVLLGWCGMALFPQPLRSAEYTRRTGAFVLFGLVLLRELVLSNFQVAWSVLSLGRRTWCPRLLTLPVPDLSRGEVYLLAHCITLTPGTTTVDVLDEGRTLLLHVLDGRDPELVREGIRQGIMAAILNFTRPSGFAGTEEKR
jgi:multisubunit Na+/H+ antiporter MnhE subunit